MKISMRTRSTRTTIHRAFTIVELLVVIAIIFILARMLLPAIGQTRKSAWGVVCVSLAQLARNKMADARAKNRSACMVIPPLKKHFERLEHELAPG